jgi:hypothetical protein
VWLCREAEQPQSTFMPETRANPHTFRCVRSSFSPESEFGLRQKLRSAAEVDRLRRQFCGRRLPIPLSSSSFGRATPHRNFCSHSIARRPRTEICSGKNLPSRSAPVSEYCENGLRYLRSVDLVYALLTNSYVENDAALRRI